MQKVQLDQPVSRMIPLSLVFGDRVKIRPLDEERVADLVASFRSKGQQQPIKVRPNPNGTYVVVFGEHRLEAAKRLGWPEISAIVSDVNELEALELKVTENVQRNHYTDPVEEGKIYARLIKERYGNNLNALSDSIGKSTSYIKDRLTAFYQLEPSLRPYVGKELTISNTLHIAKIQDSKRQVELAQAVIKTRVQAASTAWGSGGKGAPRMGAVRVRPVHACTCGCGDIHPVRAQGPISVDIGEPGIGVSVVLGLAGRSQRAGLGTRPDVCFEDPDQEGYSFCGRPLTSRWQAEVPAHVDTRTFRTGDGYRLCDNCARVWRKTPP